MRVTTGNLEGGAGKTTTVTALYLNRLGRTLLIDADPHGLPDARSDPNPRIVARHGPVDGDRCPADLR